MLEALPGAVSFVVGLLVASPMPLMHLSGPTYAPPVDPRTVERLHAQLRLIDEVEGCADD